MEMHWWCCDCDATNSSADDEHLVCSRESCNHHLCSDCYNPQQIGRDMHLNAQVVTTGSSISKSILSSEVYEQHRRRANHKHVFRNARKLIGQHIKHSKIGKAFLSFWSYVQNKTSSWRRIRLTQNDRHLADHAIRSITESALSTSYVYQSEEITEYSQEAYYC